MFKIVPLHPAAPAAALPEHAAPVLSVIVPTLDERENVARVAEALKRALDGSAFEIVFVDDDSTDGTLDELAALAKGDKRIRFIRRVGRRGLAGAVIEGMLSTSTPYLAVIDADLQHDERILPEMLALLAGDAADLVIGSRYLEGEGDEPSGFDGRRALLSKVATRLARLIAGAGITDPMSGFFAVSRQAFDGALRRLSGQGYKILLDICASSERRLRILELPYRFRAREAGESKLDALVMWEYLMLVADKLVGRVIPARFLSFGLIGAFGIGVHMAALSALLSARSVPFAVAQVLATLTAMVFNFFLNNILTYRDRRLRGARELSRGLASFVAVCAVGAVANVGIASYLFSGRAYVWWLAGLAGILVGAVWNYAMTALLTWRVR